MLLAIEVYLIASIGIERLSSDIRAVEWALSWTNVKLVLLFVVVPFLIVACLCRSGVWQVRRLVIRPFVGLKPSSDYDGQAISILLQQELLPKWNTATRGKIRPRAASSGLRRALPQIAIAGTTLPFDWIWSQIRQLAAGRDSQIAGMVDGAEEQVRLIAWSSDRPDKSPWETEHYDSSSDGLKKAVQDLAEQIKLDMLDGHEEIAITLCNSRRLEQAKAVILRAETVTLPLTLLLAKTYLQSGELDAAGQQFRKALRANRTILRTILGRLSRLRYQFLNGLETGRLIEMDNDAIDCWYSLAQARASKGENDKAIKLLNRGISLTDASRLLSYKAEILAYERNYDSALNVFEDVGQQIQARLIRYLRLPSDSTFSQVIGGLESRVYGANARTLTDLFEWVELLSRIYYFKARTLVLLRYPEVDKELFCSAAEECRKSIACLKILFSLDPSSTQTLLSLGVHTEQLVDILQETDVFDDAASNALQDAIAYYEECILRCNALYNEDPRNLGCVIDLLWALEGKFCCAKRQVDQYFTFLKRTWDSLGGDPDFFTFFVDLEQLIASSSQKSQDRVYQAMHEAVELPPTQQKTVLGNLVQDLTAEDRPSEEPHELSFDRPQADVEDVVINSEIGESQSEEGPGSNVFVQGMTDVIHLLSQMDVDDRHITINTMFAASAYIAEAGNSLAEIDRTIDTIRVSGGEPDHIAEGYYGLACLHALQGDGSKAVAALGMAIYPQETSETGLETSKSSRHFGVYRNQARLDPDFDAIRLDDNFNQLVYGKPYEAIASVGGP